MATSTRSSSLWRTATSPSASNSTPTRSPWRRRSQRSSRIVDEQLSLGHKRGTNLTPVPRKRLELRADEGTRTLDLLHGKDDAGEDWRRLERTFRMNARLVNVARRQEMTATDSET